MSKVSSLQGHRLKQVNSKKVLCITSGRIFDSSTEAAEHYNMSPASVSKATITDKPIKGLQFKYL